MVMVWYGMVNVDLYSAIITKVSNALICVATLPCETQRDAARRKTRGLSGSGFGRRFPDRVAWA